MAATKKVTKRTTKKVTKSSITKKTKGQQKTTNNISTSKKAFGARARIRK